MLISWLCYCPHFYFFYTLTPTYFGASFATCPYFESHFLFFHKTDHFRIKTSCPARTIQVVLCLSHYLKFQQSVCSYSLVLNKRPPRLLIFGNLSQPPDLILTPHLLIFANFNFSTCKILKYILSIKGISTTFCV